MVIQALVLYRLFLKIADTLRLERQIEHGLLQLYMHQLMGVCVRVAPVLLDGLAHHLVTTLARLSNANVKITRLLSITLQGVNHSGERQAIILPVLEAQHLRVVGVATMIDLVLRHRQRVRAPVSLIGNMAGSGVHRDMTISILRLRRMIDPVPQVRLRE